MITTAQVQLFPQHIVKGKKVRFQVLVVVDHPIGRSYDEIGYIEVDLRRRRITRHSVEGHEVKLTVLDDNAFDIRLIDQSTKETVAIATVAVGN